MIESSVVLPLPGRPHHQQDLAAEDVERDVEEGADGGRSAPVGLGDAGDREDGRCGSW